MISEICLMFKRELWLEWRQKFALNGILFYAFCMVFVISLSLSRSVNPAVWNGLFWIILLFAAMNAVAKSFLSEGPGQRYYLYTLASPRAVILSRIIYNAFLLSIVGLIILFFYAVFSDSPIQNIPLYLVCVLTGAWGFAATLTLISGISALAGGKPALMAVLGFPIMIPLLNVLIRMSKTALDGLDTSLIYGDLLFSLLMTCISITLSYLLFPYLWRE